MFTYYSISALINFLFSLLASIFLIVTNRKNIKNKVTSAFLRFAFFVIFWSGFYFFWQISTNHQDALLYSKLLIFFAAFIPIAYFDYSMTFLGYDNKKNKIIILLGYLLFLFFTSKGIVADVYPKLSFEFWPTGTNIFPVFLLFWGVIFLMSPIIFLFSLFKKNRKIEKNYIILSIVSSAFGILGGVTNYFLWFDIPIPPFGNILVSVYFFMTLYTVRKYNTTNLRLFYMQLPTLAITMFSFGRIFISENTFDLYTNILFFIVATIASVYIIRSSEDQEKNQILLQGALKKLKSVNDRLVEIDKHKSDFISIAAHQLRTPAGIIRDYTGMIKNNVFGDVSNKINEPLERIYENSVLLADTVSSILDISRIEAGKTKVNFKKNNISELLKKIVSEFDTNARNNNLSLNLEIKEGVNYEIVYDNEKIDHVISNLLDNAIKYTASGGVSVKLYGNDFYVFIDVSDTGRGMSKSFIENQLYQKFAREESVGSNISGNGLGMYFVKEVVDIHKGKISVVSTLDKGTKFTVAIPTKLKEENAEIKV